MRAVTVKVLMHDELPVLPVGKDESRLNVTFLLRLSLEEREAIEKLARREQRSIAGQIRYMLSKELNIAAAPNIGTAV